MASRGTVAGQVDGPALRRVWRGLEDVRTRTLVGLLALLTAAAPFLSRMLINARTTVGPSLATKMDLLVAGAIAGPALATGVLATTTAVETERVGLVFVAAFGALTLVSPVVAVPATVAVVGGGAVAVGGRWRALPGREVDWRVAPVVGVLLGTALSLAAAMGLAPPLARPVGAHLSMLGAAATPALLGHGNRDWALGGAVAGLLVAVGVVAPFVTGAVSLVGGGIVAVSLPVMAAGLAGLVTTTSAGIRTRRMPAALGAGLLLVAGVPGTLPRAMAAVLGVLLLVESRGGIDP
ncbi:MAG: hypothetical protein ACI9PP_001005 [Halobacteriales archaeon]|jgi:hypothetical protein